MIKPYYETENGKLYHGDCLDIMREMESDSVQCVVTSPPFWGLRDYGLPPQIWDGDPDCEHDFPEDHIKKLRTKPGVNAQAGNTLREVAGRTKNEGAFCIKCHAWRGSLGLEPTPELYIQHLLQIFREVRRVLRPDGTLWLNMGDSYAGSGRGRDADGVWNPGKGGSKQETNKGSTIGRNVNAKSLSKNLIEKGAIGNAWVKPPMGFKAKDLIGIPWRLALALQADGWWLRSDVIEYVEIYCPHCGWQLEERIWRYSQDRDIIWAKPNPMPESVTDRPTKAHEYVFLMSKNAKYYYDAEAVREPQSENTIARVKYDSLYRPGVKSIERTGKPMVGRPRIEGGGRNKRSVWTIATQPFPEAHFATFPEKLVIPCILAGTSEKGNCSVCGKPWVRVIEKVDTGKKQKMPDGMATYSGDHGSIHRDGAEKGKSGIPIISNKTIGWQPSCSCNADIVKPIVLDPFMGSATVAKVCEKYHRGWVGCELSEDYCKDIAVERIKREVAQYKLELT